MQEQPNFVILFGCPSVVMNNNSDYSDMLNWKVVIGLSGPIVSLKLQEVPLLVMLLAPATALFLICAT
jgi:hypothetical protein